MHFKKYKLFFDECLEANVTRTLSAYFEESWQLSEVLRFELRTSHAARGMEKRGDRGPDRRGSNQDAAKARKNPDPLRRTGALSVSALT